MTREPGRRSARIARRGLIAALLMLGTWSVNPADETQDGPTTALPTELTETVRVELVEIKVRVTDNKGQPVTDLKPEEVSVFQGGVAQRLAYLDPLTERSGELTTGPEVVYDGRGEEVTPEKETTTTTVLPPKPVRRIALVFDPRNSRIPIRDDWRSAAIEWVENSMRAPDLVGVVTLKPWPEWHVTLTSDREQVLYGLRTMELFHNIPSRDRRKELDSYIDDLWTLCVDKTGGRSAGDSVSGAEFGAPGVQCAYDLSRPRVWDWTQQSEESFDGLRSLVGELAAIPGQKAVILFSEGIIEDPARVSADAMVVVLGRQAVDTFSMHNRLQGTETLRNLTALYHRAAASDVAIFTIDTRHQNQSVAFDIEHNARVTNYADGVDPYREMYDSARATLANLAAATGGMSFYGPSDLDWKIQTSADSFFGIYGLGYYRTENTPPGGKLKIKVDRKKIALEYDKRPQRRLHQPRTTALELAIGRPVPTGEGELQRLPVALIVPLESLPLRKGAGGFGCELGVFLQAVHPDGKVAGEFFKTTAVVIDKETRRSAAQRNFRYVAELSLPPGPMRVQARLSDDRQEVFGERRIDMTLDHGEVRAGLVPSE